MSTSRHLGAVVAGVMALCLILTVVFINGEAVGITKASASPAYAARLFDTSRVHTIDIICGDWEGFLASCEDEEYIKIDAVIDGESYKNIAIRAKGNTSLSMVKQYGNNRYSFKIEFDHFQKGESCHGLDKLSLNNIIQDNTFMKDYLVYRLMGEFGADAPLTSFAFVTVNGEDWGLYLAVEGVEDAFLSRNYGRNDGDLYKPDSMSFGGGRGNGRDFDFDEFVASSEGDGLESGDGSEAATPQNDQSSGGEAGGADGPSSEGDANPRGGRGGERPGGQGGAQMPDGEAPERPEGDNGSSSDGGPDAFEGGENPFENGETPFENGENPFENGGGPGGMGSSDVKLVYSDDEKSSYSNIFDNAKTKVTDADAARLIASIKKLNENEDIESVVDVDEVLRYFVVHNYAVNGDSYTGSIVHNYYLYERDGKMRMIPWDYNLAFGSFRGNDADSAVNDDIDSPLEAGSDRPMWYWIASNEEYLEKYRENFAEFIDTVDVTVIIDEAYGLIAGYVERDPTKFCTYEEFEAGVEALREFTQLRTESVRLQLAGSDAQVDASGLNVSDMGGMGGGMDRGDSSAGDENGEGSSGGEERESSSGGGKGEQ